MSAGHDPLGALLLTGVPGPALDSETAARLRRLQPGGYILFGRNIQSPQQLRKLIDDLRDLSRDEPIITIDQEGGRVSRLRLIGQEPPNAQALRERNEPGLIQTHGRLTGEILRLFGFNLDLCPVLDISYDDQADNSLKGRCWGRDAQQVISNAGIFNAALRREGILSCGKHFPGYGPASCDPHEHLPIIDKTAEQLASSDLLPYSALLHELDSVMTCHSHYMAYDAQKPRWPASLSHNICTRLLRHQLGFEGLAITDDLDMGAILNEVSFEDSIKEALRAGNDMVMICHRLEMVELAHRQLREVEHPVLDDALRRVEAARKKLRKPDRFCLERFEDINRQIWDLRVATLGEERAKVLSVEDGKRSPVELY
jgi:beta-N-acetylhexosaminidase